MNNKQRFSRFLSDNTRATENDYNKLFNNIENKYGIDMNQYFDGLPTNLEIKDVPNTFSEKPVVTYSDDKIGIELGVDGDTISEIRNYSGIMSRNSGRNYSNEVDLSNLTDEQKTLMTQISYLDISAEGIEKINNGGLKVSQLSKYLEHPNDQFPGNIIVDEKLTKVVTNAVVGKDSIITEGELLKDIQAKGLGDLTITSITSDSHSGFQAMALIDGYDNTAISYRGSDFNYTNGGVSDWVLTDVWEWLSDDSKQKGQAIDFFDENSNANGNNYLYGHSLGGNLTTHTLLARAEDIQEAFTIDGTPVSNRIVKIGNNAEILNGDKYNCNIVAGDVVGQLKSFSGYENNVNFIQNNNHLDYSAISAHLTQSATFDKDGGFVKCDKETAMEEMGKFEKWFVNFSQNVHGVVNKGLEKVDELEQKVSEIGEKVEQKVEEAGEKFESSKLGQWLGNIKESVANFIDKDHEDTVDDRVVETDNTLSVDD